jgi:imidazolonepropionase-like amidohydrolase
MTITTAPPARRRLTALHADYLFDGVSSSLVEDPMLLLDDGRIVAVERGIAAPDGADVVELPGATLLPGLVDTHVHLAFDASVDPVGQLAARSDEDALVAMAAAAKTALAGGVTTVRDLGDRNYLSLQLRGTPGVPTIVAAGPPLTTSGGHCHYLGGVTEPGEAAVRLAVRQHVERGVDVIKIMASGGNLTPGTHPERSQFTLAALRAAVDEAHRHGLPVTAHAHGTAAIADAVSAGVDGMEHVSFWTADGVDAPAELISEIADRRIVVGATAGFVPVPGFAPPPAVLARLPHILANIRRLYEAGAPIVAGTDAGIGPVKPPDVVRHAVADLSTFGLTPAEALRAVTSGAAAVCRLADRKGRLAPGFDADILAVHGNPLSDPEAIHRIRAVYTAGKVVAPTLPRAGWS